MASLEITVRKVGDAYKTDVVDGKQGASSTSPARRRTPRGTSVGRHRPRHRAPHRPARPQAPVRDALAHYRRSLIPKEQP